MTPIAVLLIPVAVTLKLGEVTVIGLPLVNVSSPVALPILVLAAPAVLIFVVPVMVVAPVTLVVPVSVRVSRAEPTLMASTAEFVPMLITSPALPVPMLMVLALLPVPRSQHRSCRNQDSGLR